MVDAEVVNALLLIGFKKCYLVRGARAHKTIDVKVRHNTVKVPVLVKFSAALSPRINQVTFLDGAKDHVYHALATIEEEIKEKFANMIKKTDGKLTEISKIEKQSWNDVDSLAKDCERMMTKVEQASKEQVQKLHVY